MEVIVKLLRDGNAIGAIIGPDLQSGISGWGDTAPEALRDLASNIEKENWPLPELDEKPGPKLVKKPEHRESLTPGKRHPGSDVSEFTEGSALPDSPELYPFTK